MKFVPLAVLTIASFCSSLAFAAEQSFSVGVVDMQTIMSKSTYVIGVRDHLKNEFSARHDALMKKTETLHKQVEDFNKNKTTMNQTEIKKQEDALHAKQTTMQTQQIKFQQEFYQAQEKEMGALMEKVHAVVQNVAQKHHYSIVVTKNQAMFAEPSLFITQEVIDQLG
jgi:Skp family chaperone for outer membrane proteins